MESRPTTLEVIEAELSRLSDAVGEIRDLLRAQQPATPPPLDTAQGREAGETLADVLRQAMEAHNWKSAPHEMKLRGDDVRIASAVARARDRQTVAMLRREVESETNGDCRAALLWAADRIESGAVDEGD